MPTLSNLPPEIKRLVANGWRKSNKLSKLNNKNIEMLRSVSKKNKQVVNSYLKTRLKKRGSPKSPLSKSNKEFLRAVGYANLIRMSNYLERHVNSKSGFKWSNYWVRKLKSLPVSLRLKAMTANRIQNKLLKRK